MGHDKHVLYFNKLYPHPPKPQVSGRTPTPSSGATFALKKRPPLIRALITPATSGTLRLAGIVWKVVGPRLFFNIIFNISTAGIGHKVWCDRGIDG